MTNVFEYYHPDDLASTSVQTDQNGNEIQHYSYTAFGQSRYTQSATAFPVSRRYTAQILDEDTGLYYYNFRYYDPQLGRFTQPDDTIPDVGDPQSWNRYAYCLNNPFRFTDADGRAPSDLADAWSGAVSTGAGYITASPSHWIWNGTVGTANSLIGGAADPLRLGSSAGSVSGNPNATVGQIAVAAIQEASRAAALAPVGGAIGKGAGALAGSLAGTAGREAVGELAGTAQGIPKAGPSRLLPGKTGQGLTTPKKFFGNRTSDEAASALENKFGPPRNSHEHRALGNRSYFNEKSGTSYNVHTDPNHGPPHVDVKPRGGQKTEFPSKPKHRE